MEKNSHKQGTPWSERQFGMYHKFGKNVASTMIVMSAKGGRAPQRIQDAFAEGLYQPQASTSPLAFHVMALSSYIDSWRSYLREKGEECKTKVIGGGHLRLM